MTGSANGSVQTDASGTVFVALPTQFCRRVKIYNDTETDIEVQQDGGGVAIPVFAGTSSEFEGIANSNQLAVRRRDQDTAQVEVKYRWEYR